MQGTPGTSTGGIGSNSSPSQRQKKRQGPVDCLSETVMAKSRGESNELNSRQKNTRCNWGVRRLCASRSQGVHAREILKFNNEGGKLGRRVGTTKKLYLKKGKEHGDITGRAVYEERN